MACKLIGPGIKFPVGQRVGFKHHGQRIGGSRHLFLEQLVNAFVPGIIPFRPVPLHQNLMAFCVSHNLRTLLEVG